MILYFPIKILYPYLISSCLLHAHDIPIDGAHPASYPMGTRGSFPEDKAVGAWSWPLTSI
jgi:hypothetical protein